ncbi:hypothetical protein [Streptomyces sp. NPDC015131]|uniref:hypothetical protein n=1 Tax=Streptomyces sp. NPDC015131 TaxID=3364941 RepID=UPI0036F7C968
MAILGRDQILAAGKKRRTEEFEVPEWDGSVLLREMTGAQRDAFEASMVEMKKGKQVPNLANLRARLVMLCIVNEDGEQLFNPKDLRELGDMPAKGLQRVFNKCNEMNGLSDEDVKELAEGFDDDPSEDSTSA